MKERCNLINGGDIADEQNGQEELFDAMQFLEDEWSSYWEQHYSYGIKRPKYRNKEEKVKNCRRVIGWGIGEDGNYKPIREYPCHVITGDDPCEYCLSVRNYKREQALLNRLDNVGNRSLYFMMIGSKKEANRLKANCHNRGYDFLSVPVSASGEKVVIIDGPVKGSIAISLEDAKRELSRASPFLSSDRSVRVGGNLGVEYEPEPKTARNYVTVNVRVIWFNGKAPDTVEISKASVLSMVSLGQGTEITKENFQDVIYARQDKLMEIFRELGYSPYVRMEKEEKMDFDSVVERWSEIILRLPEVTGKRESLDGITKRIMSLSLNDLTDILANDGRAFKRIVSTVADSMLPSD